MFEAIASPWIPLLILVCLTCLARLSQRSWLGPGAFAGLLWSAYLFMPLATAPEYPVSAAPVWIIVLLIFCVQWGAFLAQEKPAPHPAVSQPEPFPVAQILPWILIFSSLAALGAFYLALTSLRTYGLPVSAPSLLALGHLLSVERYSGGEDPLLVRALVPWVYPAALLGGMTFVATKVRRARLLSCAPFVPTLLLGVLAAALAGVLITGCCWGAGYLAMKVFLSQGHYRLVSRRLVLVTAALALSLIGCFALRDALRVQTYEQEFQVQSDWVRIKASTFGYLAVFGHWIETKNSPPLGYGAYTFSGVFDLTGWHARAAGVYETGVPLPGGEEPNIYTAFRGLMQDYSLPGAVLLCFLVGIAAAFAYGSCCRGRWGGILVLAAFYGFLVWSPLGSLYTYNGPILAWVICAVLLRSRARTATLRSSAGEFAAANRGPAGMILPCR
jgi:oligosaccharide repeat unit polymerase